MPEEIKTPSCPQNSRFTLCYETEYIIDGAADRAEERYPDVTMQERGHFLSLSYPLRSAEAKARADGAETETLTLKLDGEKRIESVTRSCGGNRLVLVPGTVTECASLQAVGNFRLWFDTDSADFRKREDGGFTLRLHYRMALREMDLNPVPPADGEWDECVRMKVEVRADSCRKR